MLFYGFLATLPRDDYPPSFIRPLEGVLGRSISHGTIDYRVKYMEHNYKFKHKYQFFEGVKNSFNQFIADLDIYVQLVGCGML